MEEDTAATVALAPPEVAVVAFPAVLPADPAAALLVVWDEIAALLLAPPLLLLLLLAPPVEGRKSLAFWRELAELLALLPLL